MKKIISLVLTISILCAMSIVNTTLIYAADIDELSIGDYIQLGTSLNCQ